MRVMAIAAAAVLLTVGSQSVAQEPTTLPANYYNVARFIARSMGERYDVEGSLKHWMSHYALDLESAVRRNEFERANALEQARRRMREEAASAPAFVTWDSWLTLGEYDFERQAFPIKEFNGFGSPILGVSWNSQAPAPDYALIPANIDNFRYIRVPPDLARDFVAKELKGGLRRNRKAEVRVELLRALPDGDWCVTMQAYCRVEARIVSIELFDGSAQSIRLRWDGTNSSMIEPPPPAKKSRWRPLGL